MIRFVSSPAFGILLTIAAYSIGLEVKKRLKSNFIPPLFVAMLLIITFLRLTGTTYEDYQKGGEIVHFFLGPLTVVLGLSLYRERRVILRNLVPLLVGVTAGVLTSFGSILLLGKSLRLSDSLVLTLLPKSITTPMALSLNQQIGGEAALLVVMVVVTGVSGAIMAPLLPRLFPFLSKPAIGAGIGTAAHAVGTSKALEMNEESGAVSSASIGLAGLITVILVPLLLRLFPFLLHTPDIP